MAEHQVSEPTAAPAVALAAPKERMSQRKEKSKKIAEEAGRNPEAGRCNFFVPHKQRHCKMHCLKDRDYCGEHLNSGTGEGERKRIPCPLDPKHTVFEEFLNSHLKKCNAKRKPDAEHRALHANLPRNTLGEQDDFEGLKLSQLPEEELKAVIERVRAVAAKHVPELPHIVLDNPVVREEILSHSEQASTHQ
jgi:tRNA:m4X modification enzyme